MVNLNNTYDQKIISKCYKAANISIATLLLIYTPAYAGSQSLLDPYATVEPNANAQEAQPLGQRTTAKKPKSAKPVIKKTSISPNSTSTNTNANPGFLSGIKEIQHGTVTSFKAAGHGIVDGTKSVGAKIASGTGKVKDGLSGAGHKIVPQSDNQPTKTASRKRKKNKQIANTTSTSPTVARTSRLPELPGKPLDSEPHKFKLVHNKPTKAKPLEISKTKKQKNVIARAFDKFNPFAKHKNAPAKNINIAARNPNAVTR